MKTTRVTPVGRQKGDRPLFQHQEKASVPFLPVWLLLAAGLLSAAEPDWKRLEKTALDFLQQCAWSRSIRRRIRARRRTW
jgi:hypothetical protein